MKINSAATVFTVTDLDASLRYYVDVLGFREAFRFGQYAGIERDECRLHLSQQGNPNASQPGSGAVYIFCNEVDGYFAEITGRGAVAAEEPKTYEYGMRDFIVRDPDGNQVSFGTAVNSPGPPPTESYRSEYLKPERIRSAIVQLPPILFRLLGKCEYSVSYGVGTRLHGSLLFHPLGVPTDYLPSFLEDSLEQKIVEPGGTDLIIDAPNGELSLLFCHEADIHVDGTNHDLIQRFITCEELADIKFTLKANLNSQSG
ncbi:Bleomycin resistance protein [Anatilimnocola aggregata]|uniref:Bleomycin resistance protein n=1 Tax=Anatilimnocola aggregata TaxID=2528021 RepID=A0A517Y5X3_9BACT|nr:VOC family protein [Anatilimnocola aggregata]QDU25633.1 Bleomycin resistance protein [Anatilimnocola aggregata]